MRSILTIATIVAFVGVFYLQVSEITAQYATATATASAATATACACICPKMNRLPAPPTDPSLAQNSIDKLWCSPTPVLSKKALAMKDAILYLANSDVPRWKQVAMIVSAWFWSCAGEINSKPNFCGFTKIINASVCDGPVNCNALKDGLTAISNTLGEATKYSKTIALRSAGCTCESHKPTMKSCYCHGSVYPIKKFWRKYEHLYPCKYQKAAKALYRSKCYTDQLLGSIANAGITSSLASYYGNFNHTLMFQTLQMTTCDKIPECCCPRLEADLCESLAFANKANDHSVAMTLKNAGCPCH